MTLPHQDNELRKKLSEKVKKYDEEINDVYGRYSPDEFLDAILDIIIEALPEIDTDLPWRSDYDDDSDWVRHTAEIEARNSFVDEITAILTAAKEGK